MSNVPFDLLLVTDGWSVETARRLESALAALPAGRAAVQLRAKELEGRLLHEAAAALRRMTAEHGALLLINDRVDVALAVDADGVHLPAHGLPPKAARRAIVRAAPRAKQFLVGASTHSLEELRMAVGGGADYVTLGPIYPTASKAAFGPPLGIARLAEAVKLAGVPVFALGGVDAERAPECVRAGARLACIGAVLGQAEPAGAARALLAHAAPAP